MAEAKKEPCWYVIHTYSGYENKVKDTLEKSVENNGMQDLILEVRVPMEEVVEIRNGKRVKSTRKVYPGYVLVHMIETSESWYVVRNTRGVTGFVGPGSKAVPLSEAEMANMGIHDGGVMLEYAVGDSVLVVKGVWEGTIGAIRSINESKQTLTIAVDMFGRETPVELELDSVKKM